MRKYHAAGAHRGIFELNKTHEYLFKNNQEYTKIKYFALLLITIMKIRKVFCIAQSFSVAQCSHNQILIFLSASSKIPQIFSKFLKVPNKALNQYKSCFYYFSPF